MNADVKRAKFMMAWFSKILASSIGRSYDSGCRELRKVQPMAYDSYDVVSEVVQVRQVVGMVIQLSVE